MSGPEPKVGDPRQGTFIPGNRFFVQTVGQRSTVIQPDGIMEYEIVSVLERTEVVDGEGRWYGRAVSVEYRRAPRNRRPKHLR